MPAPTDKSEDSNQGKRGLPPPPSFYIPPTEYVEEKTIGLGRAPDGGGETVTTIRRRVARSGGLALHELDELIGY